MKERAKIKASIGEERGAKSGETPIPGSVIFALLLIIPAIATVLFGAVDPQTWTVLYLGCAILAGLWFWHSQVTRSVSINAPTLLFPLLGLIVIGVLQILPLFAPALPSDLFPDAPRSAISLEPYATRMFAGRLGMYFLYLAAALTFVNRKSRIRKAVVFIIIFGSLMAMFAILQRLAHVDSIYGMRDTPGAIFFGPFVNQHHFAAFMEMTSGVVLGLLFATGNKRQVRVLLTLAAVVMGIAVAMTSSRGGMISFVAVLLLSIVINLYSHRGKRDSDAKGPVKKLAIASLAGGLLVVIVGTVLYLGADAFLVRGIELANSPDPSNGRTHFWAIALRIFVDHPLWGAGLDAFGSAFTRYDTWPGIFRIEQAHNDYLQTLADAGLAGFACVGAFIYLLFKKSIDSISAGRDGFRKSAAIGSLCGCFGILVHSFFDFPLRTPSNAFFFLLLAAIAVAPLRSNAINEPSPKAPSDHTAA